MTAYAILRTEKLKSAAAIRGAGGHNARTRPTPNADPRRENLTLHDGGPDPFKAVMAKIEAAGCKVRSDAVLAQEVILTASPEYFRPDAPEKAGHWDQQRMEAWAKRAWAYAKAQWGENIIDARLHLDEATPHIQLITVPLTADKRLSAKELFGKAQLRAMQDGYGKAMSPLGLRRGEMGSKAKHTTIQQYYRESRRGIDPAKAPQVETPPALMVREESRETWAKEQTAKIAKAYAPMNRQAGAAGRNAKELAAAKATIQAISDERDAAKTKAAAMRDIELPLVLQAAGWDQDRTDRAQWHGPQGRISLRGDKWHDHDASKGGGKAIDLAMHLTGHDFTGAVAWLADHFGDGDTCRAIANHAQSVLESAKRVSRPLTLPERAADQWRLVKGYLASIRKLPIDLIDGLHKGGELWADARGNAVFAMKGQKAQGGMEFVGAELKGTNPDRPFAGLAPGSSRNRGFFGLTKGGNDGPIVLVESAIDAISYWALNSGPFTVLSTAGARPWHPALDREKRQGRRLVVAYDADDAGDKAAKAMIGQYGKLAVRQRPEAGKDWNDQLKAEAAERIRQALRPSKPEPVIELDLDPEPPKRKRSRGMEL